jgi:hypothetical protein
MWEDGSSKVYYELNICPEYLNLPLKEVTATLLHNMVHLYNALNGIQDCSRGGQYHNIKFKGCAEQHGLIVEKSDFNGFSKTFLTTETQDFVESLELPAFELFRNFEKKAPSNPSSTKKYECPDCQISVRATKEVNILCEDCDMKMKLAASSQDS